jgi:hypothetical protein
LPVKYHSSAWVYAAWASLRSSVQPRFGFELGPHSTTAQGFAVYESEPCVSATALSKAAFQGCALAWIFAFTKSSWPRFTSTPGWRKPLGFGVAVGTGVAVARGTGVAVGAGVGVGAVADTANTSISETLFQPFTELPWPK